MVHCFANDTDTISEPIKKYFKVICSCSIDNYIVFDGFMLDTSEVIWYRFVVRKLEVPLTYNTVLDNSVLLLPIWNEKQWEDSFFTLKSRNAGLLLPANDIGSDVVVLNHINSRKSWRKIKRNLKVKIRPYQTFDWAFINVVDEEILQYYQAEKKCSTKVAYLIDITTFSRDRID